MSPKPEVLSGKWMPPAVTPQPQRLRHLPIQLGFQYACSMNTSFESAATTQEAAKPNILAIFGDDTQLLKV
jgi:hypothetical protein